MVKYWLFRFTHNKPQALFQTINLSAYTNTDLKSTHSNRVTQLSLQSSPPIRDHKSFFQANFQDEDMNPDVFFSSRQVRQYDGYETMLHKKEIFQRLTNQISPKEASPAANYLLFYYLLFTTTIHTLHIKTFQRDKLLEKNIQNHLRF